jgi:hypothetical protein
MKGLENKLRGSLKSVVPGLDVGQLKLQVTDLTNKVRVLSNQLKIIAIAHLPAHVQEALRKQLLEQKFKLVIAQQQCYICSDAALNDYYTTYQHILTRLYIGSQAVASEFVDVGEGMPNDVLEAVTGKLVNKIVEMIPIIGSIYGIAKGAYVKVEQIKQILRLKHFTHIANNFNEASERFEEVARYMTLSKQSEISVLSSVQGGAKARAKEIYSRDDYTSAAEQAAKKDCELLMNKYIEAYTNKTKVNRLVELVLELSEIKAIETKNYSNVQPTAQAVDQPIGQPETRTKPVVQPNVQPTNDQQAEMFKQMQEQMAAVAQMQKQMAEFEAMKQKMAELERKNKQLEKDLAKKADNEDKPEDGPQSTIDKSSAGSNSGSTTQANVEQRIAEREWRTEQTIKTQQIKEHLEAHSDFAPVQENKQQANEQDRTELLEKNDIGKR